MRVLKQRTGKVARLGQVARMGLGLGLAMAATAHAEGIFDRAHFVNSGSFAIGIEPEVVFSNPATVGAQVHYRHGIDDLINVFAAAGFVSDPRMFRAGGGVLFDFFPDVEGQPGIGIATHGFVYQQQPSVLLELAAIPYIHKSFKTGGGHEIEPFVALPFGVNYFEREFLPTFTVTVGTYYSPIEHFRFTFELGVAVNNASSHIAGGVTYFYR